MPISQLPDPSTWSWIKLMVYAAFAAAGGILGHIMRSMDKNEKIKWGRACWEGLAAGFVGMLFLFVCQAMNLSEQWTGVIVGVSGWLGANASIRMLETIVYKKLDIKKEPTDDKPS